MTLRSSHETEAKLDTWAGFRLPELGGAVEGATALSRPEVVLDATYHDTADLRLARGGLTLRHRRGPGLAGGGEWTVKLPAGRDGPVTVRREVTLAGPGGRVPAPLASLVRARARSAPLVPVARLRTRRRPVDLVDEAGGRLVEVDDDEVSVLDGSRLAARFREVEVELVDPAAGAALEAVVARLEAAGARRQAGTAPSKLARALGPGATARPAGDTGAGVSGPGPLAALVGAAVAAGTARLVAHDPGVRLGDDAEDVHQARVAVRRLRSDLRTFRGALDPDVTDSLRADLSTLAAELGSLRDADVLLDRLGRQAAELDDVDPAARAGLLSRLADERGPARDRVLAVLDAPAYVELLDRLVAVATDPPATEEGSRPAASAVGALVRSPWRQLRAAVVAMGEDPPVEALHEVRIRAKRCRYAAEAVAPVVGRPARRLARRVAELQEVLGDINDAVVAEAWLRAAGPELEPAQALLAGELVGVQRRAVEDGRRRWPAAWDRAADRALRAWLR